MDLGKLCKGEWCYSCRAPYGQIRKEGNSAHEESCEHHNSNLPELEGDIESEDEHVEESEDDVDEEDELAAVPPPYQWSWG